MTFDPLSWNPAIGNGDRARLGRSETRPRGSLLRVRFTSARNFPTPQMFGARRAELQPRRLRSPEIQLHRLEVSFSMIRSES